MSFHKIFYFLIFFYLLVHSNKTFSIIEFSGLFGYSKKYYGENKQNHMVERSYSFGAAFYFFKYTAFELSYYQYEDIMTVNDRVDLSGTLYISSVQNRVKGQVYTISLKQMLAPKKFFIVPYIAAGYAKNVVVGETDYTYYISGQQLIVTLKDDKRIQDSIMASFGVSIQMTKVISIKGSIRTVFKFFKVDEAEEYLRYQFGLSWWI